jgi:hypothetical protein
MATPKFSRFIRPEAGRPGPITDRDLDILDAVLRYRFCSAAQIVGLVGGNEDVTHRRLRRLWERGLVTRWAFPGYHFIKKQQKHREAFHVHPIRAVLVETTEEARGKKLMELVGHPLVAGPGKRAGLFWLSISPLFTDPTPGSSIPRYLDQPEAIFDPIWALPDHSLHGLGDPENAPASRAQG